MQAMPEYLYYDDACHLHKLIRNDPFWKGTATPVDDFHYRNKHKATDMYCKTNCDPSSFPKLRNPDGSSIFNTSIAEQTNGWVGGYQAMVRSMESSWYNFFLDEMIHRRNEYVITELEKKGCHPRDLDREALLYSQSAS